VSVATLIKANHKPVKQSMHLLECSITTDDRVLVILYISRTSQHINN